MRNLHIILFFLYLSFSVFADIATDNKVQKLINNHKCSSHIKETISKWSGDTKKWRGLPDKEGPFFVKPTNKISKWIEIDFNTDTKMILHKPEAKLEYNISKECKKSYRMTPQLSFKVKKNGLDDKKLFEKIMKKKSGIIFSWSPGMNLSIIGLKNILKISKTHNIPLIIALDPYRSIEEVQKVLKKEKLSIGEISFINNLEMRYRRALIHFPNALVFKNGVIQDSFLPGLASAEEYLSFYQRAME